MACLVDEWGKAFPLSQPHLRFRTPHSSGDTPHRPDFYLRAGWALHPLKIKKNDGFHLAHSLNGPSAICSGFFHPSLVGLVARGS